MNTSGEICQDGNSNSTTHMKKHPNKQKPLEVKKHTHLEIAPSITQ